jgi:hypothetical protein
MLYNTKSASVYLATSVSKLEKGRVTGDGPEFIKIGKLVRYEQDALDKYKAERRCRTTSDALYKALRRDEQATTGR